MRFTAVQRGDREDRMRGGEIPMHDCTSCLPPPCLFSVSSLPHLCRISFHPDSPASLRTYPRTAWQGRQSERRGGQKAEKAIRTQKGDGCRKGCKYGGAVKGRGTDIIVGSHVRLTQTA